ncbi:hypothetical protein MSEN_42220 [Mycolicibacter senuensis]|uniref:Uncharacterized protein n=1 Tax=Mycolicibacter senuensis TaxID=386913 RepID=A0A7I9XR73_9MYCO|nr:hypothetical protein MSEN_42220 [Mycolicibacter senuensis]
MTSRTPARFSSLSATAVTEQLRSNAMAAVWSRSVMNRRSRADVRRAQNVPMLENIQYQNQMTRPVPPHAAT